MSRLAFSAGDRAHLRRLGLIPTQIAELENVALPICRAWLKPLAPMADVREVLADALMVIKKAEAQIVRCIAPRTDAEREVSARIEEAVFDVAQAEGTEPNWSLLAQTRAHLAQTVGVLGVAKGNLPPLQRRSRKASARPIERIEKALLDGWLKGQDLSKPLPPYMLRASSSPTSRFRNIVGICYRTIGQTEDPERAIKAYVRWRKARDRIGREQSGVEVVTHDSHPVRRRLGREPKK